MYWINGDLDFRPSSICATYSIVTSQLLKVGKNGESEEITVVTFPEAGNVGC